MGARLQWTKRCLVETRMINSTKPPKRKDKQGTPLQLLMYLRSKNSKDNNTQITLHGVIT